MNRLFKGVLVLVLVFGFCKLNLAKERGLIGYWKFDEGKGNTVRDSSGNGIDGTIQGAGWVKGVVGSALQFDGVDDCVVCSESASLNAVDAMTVEAWVKPNENRNWMVIIGRGVFGYKRPFFIGEGDGPLPEPGELYCSIVTTEGGVSTYWGCVLALSKWQHIAFTYDTVNGLKTYVDGKLQGTAQAKGPIDNTKTMALSIGGYKPGTHSKHFFNGTMDEVRIYNRALTQEEIENHYKNLNIQIVEGEKYAFSERLRKLRDEVEAIKVTSKSAEEGRKAIFAEIAHLNEKAKESDTISEKEIDACFNHLNILITALKGDRLKFKDIFVYAVNPIKDIKILPSTLSPPGEISDTLFVIATPGEYEPASFVVKSTTGIKDLELKATDLKNKKGKSISRSNIDIKIVKCWYQAGTAWHAIKQDRTKKVLIPELLLNDDSLVRVDYEEKKNYLKLVRASGTKEYVWIGNPAESGWCPSRINEGEDFAVNDSSSLLPVDIKKGTNKQFWVTVKVPEDAEPGVYTGEIILSTPQKQLGDVVLKLKVLPFKLASPKTNYDISEDFIPSVYYHIILKPVTVRKDWHTCRNEKQFKAELKNLLNHGVKNAPVYQLQDCEDLKLFARVLEMRKEVGMKIEQPLFLGGPENNLSFYSPTNPAELEALQEKAEEIMGLSEEIYLHQDVYFYGIDEAKGEKLKSQRPAWEAIRRAGGKIWVAGYKLSNFKAMGDIQDLLNCAGRPSKREAAKWHSVGHKIWCYANPQAGPENPETWRRNYGLLLYKANYDGTATCTYYGRYGNPWNDFDDHRLRDLNLVYPTVDGVVDTIAWEGYREGVDDIRYATTLKLEIERAKKSKDEKIRKIALSAEKYLDELYVIERDLDAVRLDIIRYILKLKEEGGA